MTKIFIALLYLCSMNLFSKELTLYLPESSNDIEELRLRTFYDERNRIGLLFSEIESLEDQEKIYKTLGKVEYLRVSDLSKEFAKYSLNQVWKALASGRGKKFIEVFNIDFLMIIMKSNESSEKYNITNMFSVRLIDLSKNTVKLMLTACAKCNTIEGKAENIKQRLVPKKLKTSVELLADDENLDIRTELLETIDCLEKFTCNLEFAYSKWEKLDSENIRCQSALYNLAIYWKIQGDNIKSVLYFRRAIQINYKNNELIKRIARQTFPNEFN
ncbi:transposase [Leptospira sanjuanensis]|uniref:transposase n=1 Tax=Leptospira sanjuanensis TaxID=2879643 RepID=UPI001EE7EB54|nr:transposase [Leptospira sanjuanensis]MCG6169736.1 transposase [Leptospira sanjuanensis]